MKHGSLVRPHPKPAHLQEFKGTIKVARLKIYTKIGPDYIIKKSGQLQQHHFRIKEHSFGELDTQFWIILSHEILTFHCIGQ